MVDLSGCNTLRLPAKAQNLTEIITESDINRLSRENVLFLGLGANILFINDYPGTVALVKLTGRKIIDDSEDFVIIKLGAGENWHDFVSHTVENNWSGVENMALIPGKIGAAAIGNIAAYGQNQEDVFVSLETVNLKSRKTEVFTKNDMKFAYRESVLKKNPGDYLVTSVTYKLSKIARLELSYHASRHASLLPTLREIAKEPYTVRDVFNAVVKMRTEKLPDPKIIGTAGSFFKNPLISKTHYLTLKSRISGLQAYPPEQLKYEDESAWLEKTEVVKVPAGRLLDELGWRGKKIGNVGTFPGHALTLVTYPGATGPEVYKFAQSMREDVLKNFDIDLEYEVVVV